MENNKLKKIENPNEAAGLFAGWQETLIWSCLQGVMGNVYIKKGKASSETEREEIQKQPESAMAQLGVFCFFAGKPDEELLNIKPSDFGYEVLIVAPQNEEWDTLMSTVYQERATRQLRYAIKKEPDCFSKDNLHKFIAALPKQYSLQQIDRIRYEQCKQQGWSSDFVEQYPTYEDYQKWGLGFVITKNEELVAGASSYSSFQNGIEIEVDTKEEYRRQGLATVCSAALILECLRRSWYPSWDAQNLWSVALAEKLGYHYDHEYPVYILKNE